MSAGWCCEERLSRWVLTCREVFVDGPVVHLQRGVASVPGEPHHVVLPVVHRCARLLDDDVHRADVERHPDFTLLLRKTNTKTFFISHIYKAQKVDFRVVCEQAMGCILRLCFKCQRWIKKCARNETHIFYHFEYIIFVVLSQNFTRAIHIHDVCILFKMGLHHNQ